MKCDKTKDLHKKLEACSWTGSGIGNWKPVPGLAQELEIFNKDITAHLSQCSVCQKELSELKATFELFSQVKPVVKLPYPVDDFLPQVRRKIRNQTQKRSFLPKLIPAFSSAVMIFIAVILFNNYRTNQVRQTIAIMDTASDENTVAGYMSNLEEASQNIIAEQMVNNISDAALESFEDELIASLDADELLLNLSETEQEEFIKQILTQYEEARNKINPALIQVEPVQSSPASFGG